MPRWLTRVVCLAPLLLLAAGPGRAAAGQGRFERLPQWAQNGITLRRAVRQMQRDGRVRTAHPAVVRRLNEQLSRKLGREVRLPARRIIQVTWGSAEHQQLRKLMSSSVGVGLYPSDRYGHTKLRMGDHAADAVPRSARPFPSTGTRARLAPFDGMSRRYYEVVFSGTQAGVDAMLGDAKQLVQDKREQGGNCAAFACKLIRGQLKRARAAGHPAPFGGHLDGLGRSMSAAGTLWRTALAANPAVVVVYTPPGDYRDVSHPNFRFDFTR